MGDGWANTLIYLEGKMGPLYLSAIPKLTPDKDSLSKVTVTEQSRGFYPMTQPDNTIKWLYYISAKIHNDDPDHFVTITIEVWGPD